MFTCCDLKCAPCAIWLDLGSWARPRSGFRWVAPDGGYLSTESIFDARNRSHNIMPATLKVDHIVKSLRPVRCCSLIDTFHSFPPWWLRENFFGSRTIRCPFILLACRSSYLEHSADAFGGEWRVRCLGAVPWDGSGSLRLGCRALQIHRLFTLVLLLVSTGLRIALFDLGDWVLLLDRDLTMDTAIVRTCTTGYATLRVLSVQRGSRLILAENPGRSHGLQGLSQRMIESHIISIGTCCGVLSASASYALAILLMFGHTASIVGFIDTKAPDSTTGLLLRRDNAMASLPVTNTPSISINPGG